MVGFNLSSPWLHTSFSSDSFVLRLNATETLGFCVVSYDYNSEIVFWINRSLRPLSCFFSEHSIKVEYNSVVREIESGWDMSNLRTPEVEDLLEVLSSMTDKDELYALFEDLFTIREIKETSQRLSVARLLDDGKPYTAIAEATGASATTIARVSKALNYGSGGYHHALDVLSCSEG